MIILPLSETMQNVHYAGIFGLQPIAFFIILFIVVFVGLYLYGQLNDKIKRDQYLKMVTMPDGKTLRMNAIFITATGQGYEKICDVDMHEVSVKDKDKNIKKASGIMLPPKVATQRIPQYYIHPKFIHTILWPKNRRQTQQISISEAIYRENFPLPAFSYEEMTEHERIEMTAKLAGASADQNVADAVIAEIQQKFDAFTKAVQKLKSLQWVLLGVFVAVIVGAINVILTFQTYNLVNMIRAFFGVK